MEPRTAYQDLIRRYKETSLLASIGHIASWDQHTYMPPKGAGFRAEQLAFLARLGHERLTDPVVGERLGQIEGTPLVRDADSVEAVNVREIRRVHDRAVKMPACLVEELARTTSQAQNVWAEARRHNRVADFAPWLTKIVALKREEAQAVGYRESPYDALLDEYEPGATASEITRLFAELRDLLVPLVSKIAASPRRPRLDILTRDYPVERQAILGQSAAAAIGFDFSAGRLDTTVHPFCSGIGPGDCRLTTRYDDHQLSQGFFGILHEAGHGIYDQGLDPDHFGTPMGSAVSLGIHESQSRLWENQVGRSRSFWEHFLPRTRQTFPGSLDDVTLDDFVLAINRVEPSFIRVEADEATYNLHILLRFELEQALIKGDLAAEDVPDAWNSTFTHMLGLTPPDDARGCLQDIHWSIGGLGYFPTYTLGNLYAAQFMRQARHDLGDLDGDFRRGRFERLKEWLNTNIHRRGQKYRPRELCRRITGSDLRPQPLVDYLGAKYAELYGID